MLEEDQLIKRAKHGEGEAFGLLYDRYLPQIYRFIFFKTSHRQTAEDLAQQVFLNAWKNIRSYKTRGFPLSSWLYQMARNLIIDHHRLTRPQIALERATEISENPNFDELEKSFNMELVREKIKELPADYQDVIILRFIEERQIPEVAAYFQKTEGAVKILQHRAVKQLKKLINQNGENYQKTKNA